MDLSSVDAVIAETEFAGVVRVSDGRSTLFERASGFASQRWQVPNSLDTRFDTASITKLFTSVATLQLVGGGALDLDASIYEYVDLAGTTINRGVTLRHLLSHTSGIKDDADEEAGEDYAELWIDRPVYSVLETKDFLPQFAYQPQLAEPGVDCRYCNVGYILAGLAVESASGSSYRDYVREHVFAAAGMTDCDFFDRRDAAPRVAEGWDRNEAGVWVENIFSYSPIGSPDGGAHVTASDLLTFIRSARAGELLTPELTSAFFTPQVVHDPKTKYAFGLEFGVEEDGRVNCYWKEGINAGASGIVKHFVDAGVDCVILSNSEDGTWPILHKLDDLLLA